MKLTEFVEVIRDLLGDNTIPTSKIYTYIRFNYPFILSLMRLTNRTLTVNRYTFTTNENPYTLPPDLTAIHNFIVKDLYIYTTPTTPVKLKRVDYIYVPPTFSGVPSSYAIYNDKIYFDTQLQSNYTFLLEYVPVSFEKSVGTYEPTEDDLNIGVSGNLYSNDATLKIPDEFVYPFALKVAISLCKDANLMQKLSVELQSAINSIYALGGKNDPPRYLKPPFNLENIK